MDRIEHVVRHGDFRVVATAENMHPRTPGEAKWKVLVSLWKLENEATSTPEMIRLEDRRSADLSEALSGAVALAKRRIDEHDA
jgi:TfoX/Sxy family transcriptional regulator of competence genes